MSPSITNSTFFHPIEGSVVNDLTCFQEYRVGADVHPVLLKGVVMLQEYLENQQDWKHNFGLDSTSTEPVIGKMFGVLLVQTSTAEVGFLAGFSGKLAGQNNLPFFVPPVYDALEQDGFLTPGMLRLKELSIEIDELSKRDPIDNARIKELKKTRKNLSIQLQNELYDKYHFLNKSKKSKSLIELFHQANYKNPPSAAGECAGPKLLQFAFQHDLKPLGLVEFWWGESPKSTQWVHRNFYPCCKEKCEPILAHMLVGIND